jgi:hypothetical protein
MIEFRDLYGGSILLKLCSIESVVDENGWEATVDRKAHKPYSLVRYKNDLGIMGVVYAVATSRETGAMVRCLLVDRTQTLSPPPPFVTQQQARLRESRAIEKPTQNRDEALGRLIRFTGALMHQISTDEEASQIYSNLVGLAVAAQEIAEDLYTPKVPESTIKVDVQYTAKLGS